MDNDPYESEYVASVYDERYITNDHDWKQFMFEMNSIFRVTSKKSHRSWCDVACGTGHHLSLVDFMQKTGVDRSRPMLNIAKYKNPANTDFVECDFLARDFQETFDLVTNFWFGYTHQETVDDVKAFISKLVDVTSKGGTLMISVHNQWELFDKYSNREYTPHQGTFSFDAIQWSYIEPQTQLEYKCISIHKDLIRNIVEPHFESLSFTRYGPAKELMVCENRKGP